MRAFCQTIPGAGLLALLLLADAGHAAARHSGDFLRVELGAAPVARGLSGLLLADPGTRVFWNPALLTDGKESWASFQHQESFGGVLSMDFLSWSGEMAGMPVAAFLLRQAVPDIPISQVLEGGATFEDGGRPLISGREDAADWILGLATARDIRPGLRGGLTLKFLHRNLVEVQGTGLGLDAGLRWQATPTWALGMTLRDLTGSMVFWDDGEQDWIAPEWALGGAWDRPLAGWHSRLRVEVDLRGELEGAVPDRDGVWRRAWVHGGAELLVLDRLALRGGMAEGDPSAGAGLILGRWRADYAWRPHAELGASHLVTLSALLR